MEEIGVTGEYTRGGERMNPVVGIDVAKEVSEVQAFLDKGQPYGKSFSIKHNREELDYFIHFLGEQLNTNCALAYWNLAWLFDLSLL